MSSIKTCFSLLLATLLLAACQPKAVPGWSGYVEGDYVYVSSLLGGTLLQLNVRTGDQAAIPFAEKANSLAVCEANRPVALV